MKIIKILVTLLTFRVVFSNILQNEHEKISLLLKRAALANVPMSINEAFLFKTFILQDQLKTHSTFQKNIKKVIEISEKTISILPFEKVEYFVIHLRKRLESLKVNLNYLSYTFKKNEGFHIKKKLLSNLKLPLKNVVDFNTYHAIWSIKNLQKKVINGNTEGIARLYYEIVELDILLRTILYTNLKIDQLSTCDIEELFFNKNSTTIEKLLFKREVQEKNVEDGNDRLSNTDNLSQVSTNIGDITLSSSPQIRTKYPDKYIHSTPSEKLFIGFIIYRIVALFAVRRMLLTCFVAPVTVCFILMYTVSYFLLSTGQIFKTSLETMAKFDQALKEIETWHRAQNITSIYEYKNIDWKTLLGS